MMKCLLKCVSLFLCASLTAALSYPTANAAGSGLFGMEAQGLKSGDFTYSIWNGEARISSYDGADSDVSIPDRFGDLPVTSMYYDVFVGNQTLKSIYIPGSLQSLIVQDDYSSCFSGCSNLESITVDESNEVFTVIDGVLFEKEKDGGIKLLAYPPTKKDTVYQVPDGTTFIDSLAFTGCTNLREIHVPDSVKRLWCWVNDCEDLLVYLPEGMNSFPEEGHALEFDLIQNSRNCYAVVYEGSMAQKHFEEYGIDYRLRADNTEESSKTGSLLVQVTGSNLNIRNGAGLSMPVVRKCPAGVYTITETRTADGHEWGRLKSGAGWIAVDLTRRV